MPEGRGHVEVRAAHPVHAVHAVATWAGLGVRVRGEVGVGFGLGLGLGFGLRFGFGLGLVCAVATVGAVAEAAPVVWAPLEAAERVAAATRQAHGGRAAESWAGG